jgi:hypothetical protein
MALLLAAWGCGGGSSQGFGPPHHEGGTPGNEGGTGETDSATSDGAADSGFDAGIVTSTDGFGASRAACIDTINALRKTQGLAPYTLINTPGVDMCVDEQVTYDEAHMSAHDAWINNVYPSCNGNGQDECEGYGTEPGAPGSGPHGTMGTGIIGCLYAMWAEQYQSNCLGCVGCTVFGGGCPGCDFYGMMGPECGHYVNMSATYMNEAWCGFSTAAGGTWAAQNFQCATPSCD